VRESRDTIARRELLGDFGSHLYDSAHVITADGAAFGLGGKGEIMDVLPVRRGFQYVCHGASSS
jgi:hypothetical protein